MALQFHNDAVFDEQISAESALQLDLLANQRDGFLLNDLEPLLGEFMGEVAFAGRLEQARSESPMDADR